jgi:peptidoglycan-N-acetylglucosamine deacetylase
LQAVRYSRQVVKAALAALLPRRLLFIHGRVRGRRVWLTFDDGPDPQLTPQVLNILRDYRAKATFFVAGGAAARHPDIVRRIVGEGHAVGNHTYSHLRLARTDAAKMRTDIDRAQKVLEPLCGHRVPLFRPPGGELSVPQLLSLWRLGLTVVLWNVDSRDLQRSREDLAAWIDGDPFQGGDVVLFHDDVSETVALLPRVLERIRAAGLEAVAMRPKGREGTLW